MVKLINSRSKVQLDQVGVCSNIDQNHSSRLEEVIWSFIGRNSQEKLPKVKLGKVGVGLNIALNHSHVAFRVRSGYDLPQFRCKVDQK